ncbi:MAG: YdcF family protein [Alphaproteobacteria bacterium]|nr:YdcF family protein [Alphaproteobacteria bacterium]
MARNFGKSPRRRPWLLGCLAALATAWVAGFVLFAGMIPEDTAPLSEKTDAIIVLTGGTLRMETGIALLEAGAARKLFVSGVHRGVDVAELLRIQKRQPDRLQCCIVLGHDAIDTVGNARETAVWVAQEGIGSIRLVTAGYHMPRSMLEFRAAMPGVTIVPHPVSPDHVKTDSWYRYPGTALLIAGEFSKYILSWLRQSAGQVLDKLQATA